MKIVILAYTKATYATEQLVCTFQQRGHHVLVLSPLELTVAFHSGATSVVHDGTPIEGVDLVMLRCLTYVENGVPVPKGVEAAVARAFLQQGALAINTPDAKALASDKLRSGQTLAAAGVAVPRTAQVRTLAAFDHAVEHLGLPIIFKTQEGTWGSGVMRCDSLPSARSVFEMVQSTGRSFFLQEYLQSPSGRTVKILVLGGNVLGALQSTPAPGDFRTNANQGGSSEALDPPAPLAAIALKAASLMGLAIAGVDLIETPRGWSVLEVNSTPGLQVVDSILKMHAAEHIAAYCEQLVDSRR